MPPSQNILKPVVGSLVTAVVLIGIIFATGAFEKKTEEIPPVVTDDGWNLFSDDTVTFRYPESIGTTYITATDWPPQIQIVDGPFTCTEAGEINGSAGKTERKTIDSREYCVTIEGDGAAGSVYLLYAFAFPVTVTPETAPKVAILTFGLREVQCGNYDDPQRTVCENERATFDISDTIDQIAQTLQFIRNQ